MLNSGNLIPPAGGKDIKKFQIPDIGEGSDGVPKVPDENDYEGLSVTGSKPFQLNVRGIKDGQGPKPDPRKGTMLPESDSSLAEYAGIAKASLSQGVFTHEQDVEVPWEGFDDPANLKV